MLGYKVMQCTVYLVAAQAAGASSCVEFIESNRTYPLDADTVYKKCAEMRLKKKPKWSLHIVAPNRICPVMSLLITRLHLHLFSSAS